MNSQALQHQIYTFGLIKVLKKSKKKLKRNLVDRHASIIENHWSIAVFFNLFQVAEPLKNF